MKRSYWLVSSILIGSVSLAAVGLLGCNSGKKETPVSDGKSDEETTSVAQLCKELGRAKEAVQIRDLLYQLAAHTNKGHTDDMLSLAEKQKDLLEKDFLLSADELEEVKSLTFRPLDAHYVESCLLMRSVARQLERSTRDPEDGSGLEPLELAQFVFGWTCRRVLPGIAQGDDWPGPKTQDAWVPSDIVLQRGFGSPRDRALVFLELARQLHMPGFLFDSVRRDFKGGEPLSLPLVGLLLDGNVYLFDPVLCMPVPDDGQSKRAATLAQVLKNPKLLEPLGISRDFAKSEIVLHCPLSSLSPRMKMLEGWMQSHLAESERTSLFVDAGPLRQEVQRIVAEQTKEPKVVVGIGPAQPGRFSPMRMLHAFLPPEEGGRKAGGDTDADKTKDAATRKDMWIKAQLPFGDKQIVHNLIRLDFPLRDPRQMQDPLVRGMSEFLRLRSHQVLLLYAVEPRQMLLRGQEQPMIQRFGRIIDYLNLAPNTAEADFKEDLTAWKKVAQQFQQKFGNLNSFWKLDPTFAVVLDVKNENESDPRGAEIDHEIKKQFPGVRPRMLTYVVTAGCCRDLLNPQVRFCQAERAVEQAEALQVRLASVLAQGVRLQAHGADNARLKNNAKKAADLAEQAGLSWRDAYGFLARFTPAALSPAAVEKSAQELGEGEERLKADADYASLETLQRTWSTFCFARLQLIRTREHLSARKAALDEVRQLEDDLKALIDSASLQSGLKNIRIASHNKPQSKENQLLLIEEFSKANLQIMQQMLALRKEALGG